MKIRLALIIRGKDCLIVGRDVSYKKALNKWLHERNVRVCLWRLS